MSGWTTNAAIAMCRAIEELCPAFGCHVALTGGTLYGEAGVRKDLDIVFYRIRQVPKIDVEGLFAALAGLGIERVTERDAWCVKATYRTPGGGATYSIDCFFPDVPGGSYPVTDDDKALAEAPF